MDLGPLPVEDSGLVTLRPEEDESEETRLVVELQLQADQSSKSGPHARPSPGARETDHRFVRQHEQTLLTTEKGRVLLSLLSGARRRTCMCLLMVLVVVIITVVLVTLDVSGRPPMLQPFAMPHVKGHVAKGWAWRDAGHTWIFQAYNHHGQTFMQAEHWKQGRAVALITMSNAANAAFPWDGMLHYKHLRGDCYAFPESQLRWRSFLDALQSSDAKELQLPLDWTVWHTQSIPIALPAPEGEDVCALKNTRVKTLSGFRDPYRTLNLQTAVVRWAMRALNWRREQQDTQLHTERIQTLVNTLQENLAHNDLWDCTHGWPHHMRTACETWKTEQTCQKNTVETEAMPLNLTSPTTGSSCQCSETVIATLWQRAPQGCGKCTLFDQSGCLCWAKSARTAAAFSHASCWNREAQCVHHEVQVPCAGKEAKVCSGTWPHKCTRMTQWCDMSLVEQCSVFYAQTKDFVTYG